MLEENTNVISKFIWIVLSTVLSIALILLVAAVTFSCIAVYKASQTLENVSEIFIPEPERENASYIYMPDGETGEYKLIYKVTPYTGNVQKETDIAELPEYVKMAFVSIEDERFYKHEGIDPFTTSVAVMKELLRSAGFITTDEITGGSTITQQLVKNLTMDNEVSVDRKIREISRAVSLETHYTKDEILGKYLSIVYFGQTEDGYNMYGIEAAAAGYFGKNAAELTPAEAACLAAVIQNPYLRNPVTGTEKNRDRQLYCLRKMFEEGYISADTFEKSCSETMNFVHSAYDGQIKLAELTEDFVNPEVTPWTVDRAMEEFCEFICEYKDISYEEGMQEFRNGGYEIYLTADENIQNELEKNMSDYTYFPEEYAYYTDENGEEHGEPVQAAAVVLDYTGEIKGIVGAIGEKTTSFCWSNATDACRQPGSTIKPLAAYGYGIENDLVTWADFLTDSPLPAGVADDNPWPANYNEKYTDKKYPLYEFLAESWNTGSAQLCSRFGVENVFHFAKDTMKLELNEETDLTYAAMSVGATGSGPSLLNLANSYMVFGNGGKYYPAHIVKRIKDSTSERIYLENDTRRGEQVIGEDTACIMRHLLQEVVKSGTGKPAALEHKNVAGKTGTTENYRDILFAGLTEDYASAVWIGYENGINSSALKDASSSRIWKNVFGSYADTIVSGAAFPESENVTEADFCAESGKRAGKKCISGGIGWYKTDSKDYCSLSHKKEHVHIPDVTTAGTEISSVTDAVTEPSAADSETTSPVHENNG